MHDPHLATVRRRRGRDTVFHSQTKSVEIRETREATDRLTEALQGVVQLSQILGQKLDTVVANQAALEQRVSNVESVVEKIGQLKR